MDITELKGKKNVYSREEEIDEGQREKEDGKGEEAEKKRDKEEE